MLAPLAVLTLILGHAFARAIGPALRAMRTSQRWRTTPSGSSAVRQAAPGRRIPATPPIAGWHSSRLTRGRKRAERLMLTGAIHTSRAGRLPSGSRGFASRVGAAAGRGAGGSRE
jgi:hypothetical protein